MKYILPILLVMFCLTISVGQQERQFTQFMHNKLYLNPGFAGVRELPSLTMLYRDQWMGYEGRPVTKLVSFNSSVFPNRVGFGMNIMHSSIGIMETWHATMAYSYNLRFNERLALRIGIHGMISNLGIDLSDPTALIRQGNDPSLPFADDGMTNQWNGNVGFGAYLSYDGFYLGLSVPRAIPNTIGFNNENLITAENTPHYYAMSGIRIPLGYPFELQFDFLAKYVKDLPMSFDANARVILYEKIEAGLSYRTGGEDGVGDSIDFLALYDVSNQISVGLAYDYPLSDLANRSSGSLEALLQIDLKKERGDLANPRYF